MSEGHAAGTKACRSCGEDIKASAQICRFCNREQTEQEAERVLYEGPGHLPIGQLIVDVALCFVFFIGIPLLIRDLLQFRSRRYRVTTQQIVMESGIFSKKIDLLDMFRVQDMQYQSNWGFGTILLATSDKSTPRLLVSIPNAKAVFDQLRPAIAAARKQANVSIQERM